MEGGVSIEPGQKNAIIQETIEEFLQDWPKESFPLNPGGLRMLSAQSADSSVDPLWSGKERRAERASFPYKSRSSTRSMKCPESQERPVAVAVVSRATSFCLSNSYSPMFSDSGPINKINRH